MADLSPTSGIGKSSGQGGKYTPPPARRAATSDGAVVLATPTRAMNVPVQYPMLTDTNYSLWAAKMKVLMKPLRVWSAIEGSGEYDQAADEGAFAALSQSVPDHVMLQVAECDTARDAWEMIRCARLGEDRVKKAHARQLKRQFDRLEMADGETIPEFAKKLIPLVSEIRSLGVTLNEEAVVERLFSAVPDRFSDIINIIEQWGDVSKMSLQEAIGRLTAFEQNQHGRRRSGGEEGEKLLLVSRAQLEALILKEKKKGEGSSSGKNDEDDRGGGRGRDDDKKKTRRKFDKSRITCFECGEKGHFASECEEPKKEKALLADAGDDEPALYMAVASEFAPVVERAADVAQPEVMKVKKVLSPLAVEAELEAAKAETARLRGELAAAKAKLHALSHEYRTEAGDAAVDEEYMLFLESMHAYEEEMQQARKENEEMHESQHLLHERNAGQQVLKNAHAMVVQAGAMMPATTVIPAALECHAPEQERVHTTGKRGNDQELVPPISELGKVEVHPVADRVENIFLHERKVKPKLGAVNSKSSTWYLDSGASNHMTGCRETFVVLDESIKGIVKFGDDSVVKILGKGTVLLQSVSGQKIRLNDVYLVSKLTSSILSLGQLDEGGCKSVLRHGFLSMFDCSGKLLARARKTKNRLYVLNLEKTANMFDSVSMAPAGSEGCARGGADIEPE
ncbi:unnamed protein product [Alopecurus aequalis]